MMLPLSRSLTTIAALLSTILGFTSAAAQQQPSQFSRVSALLVMVDALPHTGTAFVIQRHGGQNPGDVVLLDTAATAHDLSEAIHALVLIRRRGGDHVTNRGTMRVRPAGTVRSRSPLHLPWASRVIADLKHAPRREISGLGSVPAVEIWLPRQTGR